MDSIQTMFSNSSNSALGSPGQLRTVCELLMHLAKRTNRTILVTGHVTKDGGIAGYIFFSMERSYSLSDPRKAVHPWLRRILIFFVFKMTMIV